MPKIEVEAGYQCPLCSYHLDADFYTSVLVNVPICDGCNEELFHFSHWSTRPADSLIEKVEKQTGKSWSECRVILLEDSLAFWKSVESGQHKDWFQTAREKLGWSDKEAQSHVRKQILRYQSIIQEAREDHQKANP